MRPREWTDRAAVVADVGKRWASGTVLAEVAGAPSIFPYRIRMTRPSTAELSSRFVEVRDWARELMTIAHVRVETQAAGTRSIGRNDVPSAVWVDDIDGAVALLDRAPELAAFRAVVAATRERLPELLPWLALRPLAAVAVADAWLRILDVVEWMRANPRPAIYVRQVDLPGVDTKLIERHADVLRALLDIVLPIETIDGSEPSFARRYGFLVASPTIRLRALDPAVELVPGSGDRPVTVTLTDFASMRGVRRVFITENEVNFLAFPLAPGSIVVFGGGYDVGKVAGAPWLADATVHYWGDIDTHGFAILDLLRSKLPHVHSMLMDRRTLIAHEAQWGVEPIPVRRDLPFLTARERELYDDLRDNRVRPNLRFEQEFTSYGLVVEAVTRVTLRLTERS